jgi:hypothetical protein
VFIIIYIKIKQIKTKLEEEIIMAQSSLIIMKKVSPTAHFVDLVAPAGLYNGNVVVIGAKQSNSTYACAANTAVTDDGMALIVDVALPYELEKEQDDYVISTGEVVRGLIVSEGTVIDIPQGNITATVALAANKVVVPDAGELKMECLASAVGTESVIFNIDSLYTKNGVAMASLRCVKTQ